jgi:hypothetical protein
LLSWSGDCVSLAVDTAVLNRLRKFCSRIWRSCWSVVTLGCPGRGRSDTLFMVWNLCLRKTAVSTARETQSPDQLSNSASQTAWKWPTCKTTIQRTTAYTATSPTSLSFWRLQTLIRPYAFEIQKRDSSKNNTSCHLCLVHCKWILAHAKRCWRCRGVSSGPLNGSE